MSSPIQLQSALTRVSAPLPHAIAANDSGATIVAQAGRRRAPESELGQRLRQQFARNVRQLRIRKCMTQYDLAQAAGLGRSFVSQLERGRFSASLETIAALATALSVPPSLLVT